MKLDSFSGGRSVASGFGVVTNLHTGPNGLSPLNLYLHTATLAFAQLARSVRTTHWKKGIELWPESALETSMDALTNKQKQGALSDVLFNTWPTNKRVQGIGPRVPEWLIITPMQIEKASR